MKLKHPNRTRLNKFKHSQTYCPCCQDLKKRRKQIKTREVEKEQLNNYEKQKN